MNKRTTPTYNYNVELESTSETINDGEVMFKARDKKTKQLIAVTMSFNDVDMIYQFCNEKWDDIVK